MYRMCIYVLLLVSFLTGCNLEDDRDLCCDRYMMRFRYLMGGVDRFEDKVFRMHYYLFDGNGTFLGQRFPDRPDMKTVRLNDLEQGRYTMVALANLKDYDTPDEDAKGGLEDFRFIMKSFFPGTNELLSGDPIYWGVRTFEIVDGESNNFLTEMSNIHCIMDIRFEWEGLPPYSDGYTFQLEGVSYAYNLDPSHTNMIGVQFFPEHQEDIKNVRRSVTMEDLKLEIPVFTLRYKDDRIPKLRVWHEDEPITKPIDLGVVFREWGWRPDINPVQEYGVAVKLMLDGSIEIKPNIDAGVNDWQDGGTIGV